MTVGIEDLKMLVKLYDDTGSVTITGSLSVVWPKASWCFYFAGL